MDVSPEAVPDDVAALKEALVVARAKASEDAALIAEQKLRIARLERQVYRQRSERSSRLIDQLALTFEERGQHHGRRTRGGAGGRQDDRARVYAPASRAQYIP